MPFVTKVCVLQVAETISISYFLTCHITAILPQRDKEQSGTYEIWELSDLFHNC